MMAIIRSSREAIITIDELGGTTRTVLSISTAVVALRGIRLVEPGDGFSRRQSKNPVEPEFYGIFVPFLAERTGLEPATPGVTGRYSNQLNYRSTSLSSTWERWMLT
jgi:hypothetical protein